MCVDRFERPLPYDEHEHKPACQASELELGPQNTGVQCVAGSVSIVAGGALRKVADASSCRAVLTDRFIETSINPDAGAMYYHFIKGPSSSSHCALRSPSAPLFARGTSHGCAHLPPRSPGHETPAPPVAFFFFFFLTVACFLFFFFFPSYHVRLF